jgi:type II secretory pathway component PulJ
VLIAASILALIGGLLVQSLSSSIEVKEAVDKTSNRYHLVRSAMSRMVDEISMAFMSSHRNALEKNVETCFNGERERIDFTAFGNVPKVQDSKQGDARQLSFFLGDDDVSKTKSLMRREQANLDDDYQKGGREQALLTDVTALEFGFYDPLTTTWKDDWPCLEDSAEARPPPRVRIKLTAKMDNGEEQTFVTQSRIWLNTPLKF